MKPKNFVSRGVVLCGKCGNQVISNSGKVFGCYPLIRLACWGVDNGTCNRLWNMEYAYNQRRQNETVTLKNMDKSIEYVRRNRKK